MVTESLLRKSIDRLKTDAPAQRRKKIGVIGSPEYLLLPLFIQLNFKILVDRPAYPQ
jgi:hypothetical protein